jgi:uncharacterized protein YukE
MAKMTQSEIDKLTAETVGEISRLKSISSSMQRRIDKLQGNDQGSTEAEPINARMKVDRKAGIIRTV